MEQATKRQLAVFARDFYGPHAALRAFLAKRKIKAAPELRGEDIDFDRSPVEFSRPYTWFYCRMKVYITCSHVTTLRGRSAHAAVLEKLTGIKKWRYDRGHSDNTA